MSVPFFTLSIPSYRKKIDPDEPVTPFDEDLPEVKENFALLCNIAGEIADILNNEKLGMSKKEITEENQS